MTKHPILSEYEALKKQEKIALYSDDATKILTSIYEKLREFLDDASRIDLVSKLSGKEYFAFTNGNKTSRAINTSLFEPNSDSWVALKESMETGKLEAGKEEKIGQTLYSIAISFCACIDLLKEGDQKTSGTFFEYFIAYFFTWRVGVEPENPIRILSIDEEDTRLPTDFIYNLGSKNRKFHMPIKTSSRERSIMLWVHQKLLDGVYGTERFMGTPVLLEETKTDKRKREVVEICLPDQWRVYQLYISRLKRIYYLDVPVAYTKLRDEFPPLVVKPLALYGFQTANVATDLRGKP